MEIATPRGGARTPGSFSSSVSSFRMPALFFLIDPTYDKSAFCVRVLHMCARRNTLHRGGGGGFGGKGELVPPTLPVIPGFFINIKPYKTA